MATNLAEILEKSSGFLVSVIGPHAGESLSSIFSRKSADIAKFGYTYWVSKSWAITPAAIEEFQKLYNRLYVVFIKTALNKEGKDTKQAEAAKYVLNKGCFEALPRGLTPITGRLPSFAFKFDVLQTVGEGFKVDLGGFWEWQRGKMGDVRLMMGKSTVCVVRRRDGTMGKEQGRTVVGVARLTADGFVRVLREIEGKKEGKKGKKEKVGGRTGVSKRISKK